MGESIHREPAVAGTFYPRAAAAVSAEAAALVTGGSPPAPAIAVVSPHAGWMYSGALAGKLFAGVDVPERVLVICPNHTGHGPRASIWSADGAPGSWQLPGLDVPIDAAFVASLLEEAPALRADRDAHEEEHAIEVLLPLIAVRQPKLRLAAIVLGGFSFSECEALGAAIARVVSRTDGPTLIVASSDMSHYLEDAEARAVDRLALAPLAAADPRGLYDTVRAHGITMCGYIPTTVALVAARALGATRATVVGYATSADAGGGHDRVVGYAAVRVDA